MTKPVEQWKLRCPKCGSPEYSKREGYHPLGRYECHECKKSFFKPKYGTKVTTEYEYMRNRTSFLERRMDKLLERHGSGYIPSIEQFYSLITYYVKFENGWEEDYCKKYLIKMIGRGGYRRYDDERL